MQGPPDDLDCLRGQLLARWSYVRIDTLISTGLHEAIDQLQVDLNRLHGLIHDRYFTSPEATATPSGPSNTPLCVPTSFTA